MISVLFAGSVMLGGVSEETGDAALQPSVDQLPNMGTDIGPRLVLREYLCEHVSEVFCE